MEDKKVCEKPSIKERVVIEKIKELNKLEDLLVLKLTQSDLVTFSVFSTRDSILVTRKLLNDFKNYIKNDNSIEIVFSSENSIEVKLK